ncbi:hypothetical protein [Massilia psychrophila]|uniref:hypothetical protein n=1 Tax=Massilia psychrophila TaxID=1603353 RepID=UPI00166DC9C0|nr:hypothetical protein [Massilia psychrophila]
MRSLFFQKPGAKPSHLRVTFDGLLSKPVDIDPDADLHIMGDAMPGWLARVKMTPDTPTPARAKRRRAAPAPLIDASGAGVGASSPLPSS